MCQTIQVKRHFRLSCDRLQSISSCNGTLWCCKLNSVNTRGTQWELMMEIKSSPSVFLSRFQGQYHGGVEERLSETSPESARTTKRIHNFFQLCTAVTWGTPTPHLSLYLGFIVAFDSRLFFLIFPVCVCQSEELWSACVDSGEVCIWHIKDTSKPFHRVALPDCTGCYCMIKVKNQVNTQHKETHT